MQKLSTVSKLQIGFILFFSIVYGLLTFVNHYNFRSYAYDLGIMNNAVYDYAHFRFNNCTLLTPELNNYLSEHFELFIMFLSPFIYIFGSYTLLIFQIAFVLFGGVGVYKFIYIVSNNKKHALWAQLHFYFFYGIFSAFSYEFHNNVLGAMFVPWFFYFFHLKQWRWASLVFLFQISTKENMPLWMAFICIGLCLLYWKDKSQRLTGMLFALASFLYFLLIVQFVMPALANHGETYVQLRSNYSALGSGMGDVVTTIFTNPVHVFKLLFVNHTGNPSGDDNKMETYLFFLLSGGLLLFLRPQFLIMLIPIIAQKMFHNDYLKWGIGFHYSVEFAPVCSLGVFFVIAQLKDERWKKYLAPLMTVLSLTMTIRSFDQSSTYFNRDLHRIYQARHYKKEYDVKEAYRALSLIPQESKVSAQSPFVPHLAFRDYIYQFPEVRDAEYIVFSFKEGPYPATQQYFDSQTDSLKNSEEWEKIYDQNEMIILKRKII